MQHNLKQEDDQNDQIGSYYRFGITINENGDPVPILLEKRGYNTILEAIFCSEGRNVYFKGDRKEAVIIIGSGRKKEEVVSLKFSNSYGMGLAVIAYEGASGDSIVNLPGVLLMYHESQHKNFHVFEMDIEVDQADDFLQKFISGELCEQIDRYLGENHKFRPEITGRDLKEAS